MRALVFPVEGSPFKRDFYSLSEIEDFLGGDFMAGVHCFFLNIIVKVGAKEKNNHFNYLKGVVILIPKEWDKLPEKIP